MFIKVAQKDFTRKMIDFDTFTKFLKNVRDLGKLSVTKSIKSWPKSNKLSDLVTLLATQELLSLFSQPQKQLLRYTAVWIVERNSHL